MAPEAVVMRADDPEPFDFGGLAIRDYTAGRHGRMSLALIEVPPRGRHPEAWSRRSDKLYYVLAGTLQFEIDGGRHELRAGDACAIPQGCRFSYDNTSAAAAAAVVLVHAPPFRAEDEVLVEPVGGERDS